MRNEKSEHFITTKPKSVWNTGGGKKKKKEKKEFKKKHIKTNQYEETRGGQGHTMRGNRGGGEKERKEKKKGRGGNATKRNRVTTKGYTP